MLKMSSISVFCVQKVITPVVTGHTNAKVARLDTTATQKEKTVRNAKMEELQKKQDQRLVHIANNTRLEQVILHELSVHLRVIKELL
jgi:hypothetical protein